MSRNRKAKFKNRRVERRLILGGENPASEPATIPTWWLNSVIAVFLLPLAAVVTLTFFTSFSHAAVNYAFWASEEFYSFSLGAVLWLIAFFGGMWISGVPRPVRVYVFGHELTHAIWVWAMGGKIAHFHFARSGGHIVTDTHNFWIALAPYFYPIYSIGVIALYGLASVFYDLTPFTWLLFALIGMTWAFHISFTIWIIPKGQSDLTHHGTFFSLVIIYLMNVLLLSALLIIAAPEISWAAFGDDLLRNVEDFSAWAWRTVGS